MDHRGVAKLPNALRRRNVQIQRQVYFPFETPTVKRHLCFKFLDVNLGSDFYHYFAKIGHFRPLSANYGDCRNYRTDFRYYVGHISFIGQLAND